MKIAYVYDAVYPWIKGGAELRIYELSKRLANRGHEVHCYGIKWWEGEKEILRDNVHLHGICRPMPLYSGERRSIKEAIYFASKVLSLLNQEFDLIDCQEFPYLPCFSAKLASGLRRQELFITWHEVWGDYWYEYLGNKGSIGRLIEKATSRLTDKNIAVSERTRKDLEGLGAKGVQIVPGGIDYGRIQQVSASATESDVIYVGRLVEHKNVDLLIKAVSLAAREVPDIRMIIVGDGPEMAKLKALSYELGLTRNVKFTGFLEDYDEALALMKSSRVFISPSAREGFGIAALEANACGLPIVTIKHRMNAVCDLVTDETGIICEPTEEDLKAAVISGLHEGDRMRKRCEEISRRYDWDNISLLAERVYERSMRKA